jgi:hypothetical protein
MKNILIPTTLQADTLTAVEIALQQAQGESCTIVLMLVADVPHDYSASAVLRHSRQRYTPAQYTILAKCNAMVSSSLNCRMEMHNRLGVSAPLLKNLLKHLDIGLVILLPSYMAERLRVHRECCRILTNSKTPVLHMCATAKDAHFSNALYLEDEQAKFDIQELQQMISGKFPVRIVSRATFSDGQNPDDLAGILASSISQNNIDLVVQTRKPGKFSANTKPHSLVSQSLGLPVLSLYEGA